jgi:hypothetical protein
MRANVLSLPIFAPVEAHMNKEPIGPHASCPFQRWSLTKESKAHETCRCTFTLRR